MARKEEVMKERLRKLKELEKLGIEPYPSKFDKSHDVKELQEKFKKLKAGSVTKEKVKVAGRLLVIRDMGKLIFADLRDEYGKIQLQIQEGETPKKQTEFFKKFIDSGDFIGVEGRIIKTRRGELSVLADKVELLSKALLPLPEKWHGLKDKEERYRRRYLDLIMNPEVKKVFIVREKIIEAIREFMKKREYTEVQTPILQPIYGGGSARPFESKLNALDMKVYMRISNELYLKRLLVGGFEKIFEFSTDFRNEGIDKSHNPEFTLFEAMTSYNDYKDGMKLVEDITEYAVKKINGNTKVTYQGKVIDFKKPWEKISVRNALKKYAKIDIEKTDDKRLKKLLLKNNIKLKGEFDRGKAIMALVEEFCEEHFVQPTILYDYPIETSALAKPKRDNPKYAERFEQYYNCFEAGNNYSELNNPKILEGNWKKQEQALKKGDEEAQRMDRDFITALKVGMPPTCGIGISVDRLVMLLTNSASIRDVIFFPFMKPKK
jgi:lysyl-tRNA synthetase class 2